MDLKEIKEFFGKRFLNIFASLHTDYHFEDLVATYSSKNQFKVVNSSGVSSRILELETFQETF